MNDFEANARAWGADGIKWLESIPALIQKYEQAWSFRAGKPFPLSYNYVAPVVLANGTEAVLKIGFPGDPELQSEIRALQIFDGDGICKLLKLDAPNAVMLLEQIMPGDPLGEAEDDDDSATRIIVSVMKKLHKPLPPNHGFITPDVWATALPEYRAKHHQKPNPSIPMELVDRAEQLFTDLMATSAELVLTHGDLHHFNVLRSDAHGGWAAIDPKGIAAEPAYEVAAMLRNPYDKLGKIDDLAPLLRKRIAILSQELDVPQQRIKDWGFAQCILSAVWSDEGVKGSNHALRVAKTLQKI